MRRLLALAGIYSLMALGQAPTIVDIVKEAALAGNFVQAEKELTAFKAAHGGTPQYLEAFSWIGRGQLAAKHYALAEQNAAKVRKLAIAELELRKLDADKSLPIALGASIEVTGQAMAAQGNRDQAVTFLRDEAKRWQGTSIVPRIRKNLNLLTLEGKPAPALDHAGTIASHHNHPVLLFFWAHWCGDCKIEVASVRKLNEAYGPKGLQVVAPTQHYGYVAGGAEASVADENKYIGEIWSKYYSRIGKAEMPVSETNFQTYGVSTTPTMVLIDKQGIVRMYNPGKVSYEELSARIQKLL